MNVNPNLATSTRSGLNREIRVRACSVATAATYESSIRRFGGKERMQIELGLRERGWSSRRLGGFTCSASSLGFRVRIADTTSGSPVAGMMGMDFPSSHEAPNSAHP